MVEDFHRSYIAKDEECEIDEVEFKKERNQRLEKDLRNREYRLREEKEYRDEYREERSHRYEDEEYEPERRNQRRNRYEEEKRYETEYEEETETRGEFLHNFLGQNHCKTKEFRAGPSHPRHRA